MKTTGKFCRLFLCIYFCPVPTMGERGHKDQMESLTVEYKQQWDDKYLRYISGFANAQGGTLFIGSSLQGSLKTGGADMRRSDQALRQKVCKCLSLSNCMAAL